MVQCRNSIQEAVDHIYYQGYRQNREDVKWYQQATQLSFLNDISDIENEMINSQPVQYDLKRVYFNISLGLEVFKNGMLVKIRYKNSFIDPTHVPFVGEKLEAIIKRVIESQEIKIKEI